MFRTHPAIRVGMRVILKFSTCMQQIGWPALRCDSEISVLFTFFDLVAPRDRTISKRCSSTRKSLRERRVELNYSNGHRCCVENRDSEHDSSSSALQSVDVHWRCEKRVLVQIHCFFLVKCWVEDTLKQPPKPKDDLWPLRYKHCRPTEAKEGNHSVCSGALKCAGGNNSVSLRVVVHFMNS